MYSGTKLINGVSASSVGIIRNRMKKFTELRLNFNEEKYDKIGENESSLVENGKTSLLGKTNWTKLNQIELEVSNRESRVYLDLFNQTNVIYEELKTNCKIILILECLVIVLQKEQQKRIIPKFDDVENKKIDKKIKELVREMTKQVRKADENVQQLGKLKLTNLNDEGIKENMKMNLAEKVRDFSKEFKTNEERYMKKYQELVGDLVENLDDTSRGSTAGESIKGDFLQTQDGDKDILRKRDEEITTLVNSISELANIYKDMQQLVSHQGTILDRIDYNIESSLTNVKDAHKQLVKTEKMMKSNCWRNCTIGLIIAIFILSLLLILKFT